LPFSAGGEASLGDLRFAANGTTGVVNSAWRWIYKINSSIVSLGELFRRIGIAKS
jgi:hypothetical protein